MSNMPTLPDPGIAEPIPDEEYDDDVVGVPDEEDDGVGPDLPDPANSPLPSDVDPANHDTGIQKPM